MSPKKNDNNQQNPVDKIFREGLHDRSFDFDEKNWENAESMLNDFNQMKTGGKSGRNRKLWLLGGVFLAAGLLVLLWFNTWNNHATNKNGQDQSTLSVAQEEIANNEILKQYSTNKSSEKIEKNSDFSQQSDNQSVINRNLQENKASSIENEAASTTENRKKPGNTKDAGNADDVPFQPKKNTSTANVPNIATGEKNVDNTSANPVNADDDNLLSDSKAEDPTITGSTLDSADINVGLNNSIITAATNEEMTDSLISSEIGMDTVLPTTPISSIQPKKSKGDFSANWFIDAGLVLTFAKAKLTATNPDLNDWITYRTNNEVIKPSMAFSLTGGLSLQNFSVAGGINAYRIVGDVTYDFSFYNSDTTYEYVIDTGGVITDSIPIINFDTVNNVYTGKNTLSYYEIPILIGYRFESEKWAFGLQTGPSLSILNQLSITYPTTDLTTYTDTEITYFRETSFNWIAKPTIGYRINDKISIGVSSLLRWNLSSLSSDKATIEKYNTTTIEAGLHIQF